MGLRGPDEPAPAPGRSTTSTAPPATPTTKPYGPSATASWASCTAAYATTAPTTNTPPGHTAHQPPLDNLRTWDVYSVVGSENRCHVAGLRSAGSPLCLTRCHRSPVSFSCHFFLARLINAPPSVPVTDTGAGRTAAWALSVLTTPFLQLVAILARRRDRPSRSRRRAHPAAAPRAGPAARSDRRRGPPSADPSSGAGHRSAQCAAAVEPRHLKTILRGFHQGS